MIEKLKNRWLLILALLAGGAVVMRVLWIGYQLAKEGAYFVFVLMGIFFLGGLAYVGSRLFLYVTSRKCPSCNSPLYKDQERNLFNGATGEDGKLMKPIAIRSFKCMGCQKVSYHKLFTPKDSSMGVGSMALPGEAEALSWQYWDMKGYKDLDLKKHMKSSDKKRPGLALNKYDEIKLAIEEEVKLHNLRNGFKDA